MLLFLSLHIYAVERPMPPSPDYLSNYAPKKRSHPMRTLKAATLRIGTSDREQWVLILDCGANGAPPLRGKDQ
jgi:hypothetical protein